MLRKHNDRLNNQSYSMGISKHVPNDSVNLAYIASPEITEDNVSIVTENIGIDAKEEYNERDNLHYVKDGFGFVTEVPNQDILMTDEFSIKKYSDEIPEPLYYRAFLKKPVSKGDNSYSNSKLVPYQYGYSLKTEDMIKADSTAPDLNDYMTPLVYRETYETGYNNILSITTDDGEKVLSGFKIRMISQGGGYFVEIYNNFDQDKIYKVTYIDAEGNQTTEVLESALLFTRVSMEQFELNMGSDEYWMAKEYAILQTETGYKVYSPAEIVSITDDNRKPFEFKYRVLANLKGNYNKSAPAGLKLGILYLNTNASEDMHGFLTGFNQSIGTVFPEYVSFTNPHPPARYEPQLEEYKGAAEYWDVDLTAPQDYINDYDIIFITGYGNHDLSVFNEKLVNYLNSGGKVVIDNLSNDALSTLNVTFGLLDPIVSYTMTGPGLTLSKEFGLIPEYKTRYYELTNVMANRIAHIYEDTSEVIIGPTVALDGEDANLWSDIIKYSSGSRSIAMKTFNGKGKIILSNSGILKGFAIGAIEEARKFVVNMTLALSEDKWEVTPWIYDRVYHKNQLYKHEYAIDHYVTDISPLGGNAIVAKKIISDRVKNFVSYYTGTYGMSGTYHLEAFERNSTGQFIPLTSVYMPTSLTGDQALYAFARSTNNTNFNITSVDGYEDSNVYPYSAPVTFKVAITPFTFRWKEETEDVSSAQAGTGTGVKTSFKVSEIRNIYDISNVRVGGVLKVLGTHYGIDLRLKEILFRSTSIPANGAQVVVDYKRGTGTIIREKVEAEAVNRVKLPYTITRDDGFVNLGLLSTMLPQIPGGSDWADKSNVFFRIEISANEDNSGSFINAKENRINLYIYDKLTGSYLYTSDSDNVISYDQLYRYRAVERRGRGADSYRQQYEDIVLQASTNYYELIASKRVYGIVSNVTRSNAIKLPASLNTNESWFPRVRYMRLTKNSFDKEDYDRISKTVGFRYDMEYILQQAEEYYGLDLDNLPATSDDPVINVIKKLNGDEVVDVEDIAILSEAFDILKEDATYEYDIIEYMNQPWDEYPYRSVKNEYAQYVNGSTIKVQYSPLNVERGESEDEGLLQATPRLYKGQHENWQPSYATTVQMETEVPGVWETLVEGFTIDYANGLVVFAEAPPRDIRASYTYSNIKVIKKTYMNVVANMEELTKLQDKTYIIYNSINRRILRLPNPQLIARYTGGETKILAAGSYSIDYETGFVTTSESQTGTLYMTYSYANVENLEIADYDSRHGIIELKRKVHFNDNIYVSYSYKEDYYEYHGYLDTSVTDENGDHKFMYIDLNPTRGHECTYPVIENNEVVYREIPTYKLLGKTLYLYMLPRKITRGSTVTTQEVTIRHTFNKEELVLLQIAHPELMVIGSIKLMNNYTAYNVITLDTRKRGGGLKEEISKEKIEKFDELSLNLWDVSPFDGRSYHPNGITVIKLPKEVLDSFTQEDVAKIVETHLAFGVMPIIKYY